MDGSKADRSSCRTPVKPQTAGGITFKADGQVLIDVEKYDLIFDGGEG